MLKFLALVKEKTTIVKIPDYLDALGILLNQIKYRDMAMTMDFRMDKISWVMLVAMLGIFIFYLIQGGGTDLPMIGYFQVFGIAILSLIVLIALMSIPVVIVCYFIQKIPDIDYSIWVAFAFTIVGLISELF